MRFQGIDLRWVFVIVLVIFLLAFDGLRVPRPLAQALALVAGAYLLNVGWQQVRDTGAVTARPKVTYWRGERIVLDQPRRRSMRLPPWPTLGSALLYLLLGLTIIVLVVVSFLPL